MVIHTMRIGLALLFLAGCAPLPDDPYEAKLVQNDRESLACDMIGSLVTSDADNAACQARAAAKRQQVVAEEMQRRQEAATREQTEAMTKALEQQPATTAAPAVMATLWCTVVVDGTKAIDACYPDRQACNAAWADMRSTGRTATDCSERTVAVQPVAAPQPVMPTKWCLGVAVEGGTTAESCYDTKPECTAAHDFHRQSGTRATSCAEKAPQ